MGNRMLDGWARTRIDPFLDRLGAGLAAAGISANTLTLAACGVGLAAALAIAAGWFWSGLVLLLVNRLGDGLDGARSGLWFEYSRIVGQLRPRYVVVENVAALSVRGLDRVLGELAGLGFDAVWSRVSSCAVGCPHLRQRMFLVAYADSVNGRARLRDSVARAFRPLQAVHGFASARTGHLARLADPSALYRGADGVPGWLDGSWEDGISP